MSNKPLVSVCMLTFNHESSVVQAIESVLMQRGDFSLRLIIGDDASKDKTGNICKEYADRYPHKISFYQNETNLGPKLNFGRAMKNIPGDYITFCDGDDYWTSPDKLQKQIVFLQDNREYNICFHKTKILLQDGRLVDDFITKVPGNETTVDDLVRVGNYIHIPSVVLRNNFVLSEWYFNCPIGDYPLYLIAARNSKIKYLPESMAVYRYGGSYSKSSPVKKRVSVAITLNELIKNYPDEEIKKRLIRKQRKEFLFFLLIFPFFGKGNIDDLRAVITAQYKSSK